MYHPSTMYTSVSIPLKCTLCIHHSKFTLCLHPSNSHCACYYLVAKNVMWIQVHCSIYNTLSRLGKRTDSEERETHALKMNCIGFMVERCVKDGPDSILKL